MKAVKILTIVGLCFYGFGLLSNIFNSFFDIFSLMPQSTDSENLSRYFLNTILLTSVSVLIKLIIGALLGFFTLKFLKNPLRKNAIGLAVVSCAVMLWNIIFTALSFTPAIPQYLILSQMGLIDTYITYLLPILKNGTPLMFIGSLIVFIGSISGIFKKRKNNDEIQ